MSESDCARFCSTSVDAMHVFRCRSFQKFSIKVRGYNTLGPRQHPLSPSVTLSVDDDVAWFLRLVVLLCWNKCPSNISKRFPLCEKVNEFPLDIIYRVAQKEGHFVIQEGPTFAPRCIGAYNLGYIFGCINRYFRRIQYGYLRRLILMISLWKYTTTAAVGSDWPDWGLQSETRAKVNRSHSSQSNCFFGVGVTNFHMRFLINM